MTRAGRREWAWPEQEGGPEKKWAWPQSDDVEEEAWPKRPGGFRAWAWPKLVGGALADRGRAQSTRPERRHTVGVAKTCGRGQDAGRSGGALVGVVKAQGRAREGCGRGQWLRGVAWRGQSAWLVSGVAKAHARSRGALWAWSICVGGANEMGVASSPPGQDRAGEGSEIFRVLGWGPEGSPSCLVTQG